MAKPATQKSDNSEPSTVEKASAAATDQMAVRAAEIQAAKAEAEAKAEVDNLQGADTIKDKELYMLGRPYWNGRVLVPRGSLYYFKKGEAPKTAKLVNAEAEAEADDK